MKTLSSPAARYLFIAALLASSQAIHAQDGALDGTFTPFIQPSQVIDSLAYDADNNIYLTGIFNQIKDKSTVSTYSIRNNIAQFTNGGVLTSYAPTFNSRVLSAAVEPNGTVLYSGLFTVVNDTSRRVSARLLSNGTLDSSFSLGSPWNSSLSSVTSTFRHRNGYLLLSDHGMMRIKLDGSNDSTFSPLYNSSASNLTSIASATIQPSGSYLIQGPFVNVIGSNIDSNYLERLNADGTTTNPSSGNTATTAFTPNPALTAQVNCSAIQKDGKILVGGQFGTGNGYPLVGLTRMMPNGEKDEDFHTLHKYDAGTPFIDGAVRSIAIQADGKILIAGDFVNIRTAIKQNGLWVRAVRKGVARLHSNGSLDETFDAKIPVSNATVWGVTLQADGKILIVGNFSSLNGSNRPNVARLTNSAATKVLSYNGSEVRWTLGGSTPSPQYVTFEHQSLATNFEWQPVGIDGYAERDAAPTGTTDWVITPTTPLPAGTLIRAIGRVAGSQFNGSTSIISETIGYMVPKIGLQRDTPQTPIINNSTTNLGTTGVSYSKDVSFTLQNTGEGDLTGIQTAITGTNASEFSVITPPDSTVTMGSTSAMEIRFKPTSTGSKTATLKITSSDPLTPVYTVTLTGTAISAIEHFRQMYFNTTSNTGNAADNADPDGDGQTNLFEFVAGMDPTDRTSLFRSSVEQSAGSSKVIFGPALNDREYEIWTTTTLNGSDWVKATGTTQVNGTQRIFTDSNPFGQKRFYRVKIIRP